MDNHNTKILDDYDKNTLKSEKEGSPSIEEKDRKDVKEATASPFLHNNWVKIFLVLLIIVAFVAFISIVMGLKESKECLGNPFTYGAKQIETPHTGNLICNCFFSNPKYAPFIFDSNNISVRKNEGIVANSPSLFNISIEN